MSTRRRIVARRIDLEGALGDLAVELVDVERVLLVRLDDEDRPVAALALTVDELRGLGDLADLATIVVDDVRRGESDAEHRGEP